MDYTPFIKIYQLTTGRRLFALRQVRELAALRGQTALVERLDAALAHDSVTRRLDLAWSGVRLLGDTSGVVGEIDRLLDSGLIGLRDMAQALTRGARRDDPIHNHASLLLSKVFPAGVVAITSLPYVDQLAAVEAIIDMLQGELAPTVAVLGIQAHVARLISLTAEYRAAQEATPTRVTYSEVRTARARGHAFLCEIVAMILGAFHLPDRADHAEARAALLAPILAQNAAIREYRQRRRAVVDIDPDTGEPDADLPADERSGIERGQPTAAPVPGVARPAGPAV